MTRQGVASDIPGFRRASAQAPSPFAEAVKFMGGKKVFAGGVASASDIHDQIIRGIPAAALIHMVASVHRLRPEQVGSAVGVSVRTLQRRRRDATERPLSVEQGDRAWQFAELLVKASRVLGSQEEAERWFDTPAMALDQKRPLELLTSSVGARMVDQLLTRIDHGVYT